MGSWYSIQMNTSPPENPSPSDWREKLHEIIFEADTPAGKAFDVALLVAILISVVATCLQTVDSYGNAYKEEFNVLEWTLTILFTVEYVLRIVCVKRPLGYIFSFFGIVDLLAILPTYIGVVIKSPNASRLAVVRALRLLRVFRVFKLGWFVSEASALRQAVYQSRAKIIVFLFTVLIMVTLAGTVMYLIEHDPGSTSDVSAQFDSIPDGIYWAIVTMTTVGYGDLVPKTTLGKFVSALLILVGYSLIIVPTGFVSAELVHSAHMSTRSCPHCMTEGHLPDAVYCRICGNKL